MTNSEIIRVLTISESSNFSAMGPIAPEGAEDANVVFNTNMPASMVRYHFFPFDMF